MKKTSSILLVTATLLGIICMPVYATEIEPRESYVFSSYLAYTYEEENKGEIGIVYSVTCSHPTTIIGASSIEIYEDDGTHVLTVEGTVENGLLRNGGNCAGTYIFQGESGVSYYAAVRFYGVADGITDTRVVVTNSTKAP